MKLRAGQLARVVAEHWQTNNGAYVILLERWWNPDNGGVYWYVILGKTRVNIPEQYLQAA